MLQEEVMESLRAFLRQGTCVECVCGWVGGRDRFRLVLGFQIHVSWAKLILNDCLIGNFGSLTDLCVLAHAGPFYVSRQAEVETMA